MSQRNTGIVSKRAEPTQFGLDQRPLEIIIENVSKLYSSDIPALESINLTIKPGERLVVLGPSGSGKSTLLRIIAGLDPVTSGRILIGGKDQQDVPPHQRNASMIFQNPALFPHLSVFENVAFGLRAREKGERVSRRVLEVAETLGLAKLLDRRPAELSGGERQRVAIGRAIAWQPRILLLDEPFSSLDPPLRMALRDELLEMHSRFGMTLVHVTHDQGEALAIGDRVAVLAAGRLLQCDTPLGIYEQPSHRSIAEFIGSPPMNVFPCELRRYGSEIRVSLPGDEENSFASFQAADHPLIATMIDEDGRRLDLGIRPEHISFGQDPLLIHDAEMVLRLYGRLERIEYQGHESWGHIRLDHVTVKSRISGQNRVDIGDVAPISFPLAAVSWFEPDTGVAIRSIENPFADAERAC